MNASLVFSLLSLFKTNELLLKSLMSYLLRKCHFPPFQYFLMADCKILSAWPILGPLAATSISAAIISSDMTLPLAKCLSKILTLDSKTLSVDNFTAAEVVMCMINSIPSYKLFSEDKKCLMSCLLSFHFSVDISFSRRLQKTLKSSLTSSSEISSTE